MAKSRRSPGRTVEVRVELKPGVLDAEATSTARALEMLGIRGISEVRIAKIYELRVSGVDSKEALHRASESVERLLANPVIHQVSVRELP